MSDHQNPATKFIESIQSQIPNVEDLIKQVTEELHKHSPRVIICGPTGVGKSSIINCVFREEIASKGIGAPVSEHIVEYTREGVPVKILDTPGFEINNPSHVENVINEISKRKKSNDHTEHVHIMWYCVAGPGSRFQKAEVDFLNKIANDLPVVIILTKTDQDQEETEKLAEYIRDMNLDVRQVLMTSAKTRLNLDVLVTLTRQLIPEAFRKSFINAQISNINEKEEAATKWLYGYVTGAAITGLSPIPFSDWIAIVPIQLSMMVHIASIFGIKLEKDVLSPLATWTLATGGASVAGRFLASLLKFIPGLGTIAGSIITAGIAGSITLAMGKAYIKLLSKGMKSSIEGHKMTPEDVENMMKEEYSKARND